jgi:hypothetical protein
VPNPTQKNNDARPRNLERLNNQYQTPDRSLSLSSQTLSLLSTYPLLPPSVIDEFIIPIRSADFDYNIKTIFGNVEIKSPSL